MNPLVSVIIPFYNRVDWLCEAVQSVLDQTYNNFEIIVVNDGSKEDVTDFLRKYGDKIIYRYKENGGAATARNVALEIANGEYIAFLDSDDIWLPEKTEKQITFMKERDVMWSHTGFLYWNPDTDATKVVDNKYDFGDIYLKYFISVRIATPSVIINRRLFNEFDNLNFPENHIIGEDSLFYKRIGSYYPLYLINEPLVKVRLRGNNSNTRALVRFSLKSHDYLKMKYNKENYNKISSSIKFIYKIYHFYSKIFGYYENNGPRVKEFIAKVFWILPFCLERLYLRKLVTNINPELRKKYTL